MEVQNIKTGEEDIEQVEGIVFDTERFTIHDGHGIRTLVFLKGCPLRCRWCSNPESQKPYPQLGFHADKCAFCLECVKVCPNGQYFKDMGKIDWKNCQNCLKCVDVCMYGARVAYGKTMTVREVVDLVKRDRTFYNKSGGGLTLGGGEPTFQPKFARAILKACQGEGIHTAMETCAYATWPIFSSVIEHVDLLLFDIKHMNSQKHKEYTGVNNEMILENAINASKQAKEMIVRFPLLPGFNDDPENVHRMGTFIKENMPNIKRLDILPYHSTGESKKERMGKEYTFKFDIPLSEERIEECKKILTGYGLDVSIGG